MASGFDVLTMPRDDLIEVTLKEVARQRREEAALKLYRFGFLRLPLNTTSRLQEGNFLHLWLDGLDRDEAPHPHNCQIDSRVVGGRIVNSEWSAPVADEDGDYRWIKTICSDTVCQDVNTGQRANVSLQSTQPLGPKELNDAYSIPVGQFHSTEVAGTALTIIRKSDFVTDPRAPIDNLLPLDVSPKTTPFDISTYDQRTAWSELYKALSALS